MAEGGVPTKYGPRKIGEEAFAAQQATKRLTTESGVVYGKRKGGSTTSAFDELKAGLYDLKVDEVVARVARITDPKELAAAHAMERSNPSHKEGRKGVLNAIEERKGELAIAAAGGTPETNEDEDEAADVADLREILEADPSKLDALIDAELAEGAPRPEALELFLEFEGQREGGARESVLKLLVQDAE